MFTFYARLWNVHKFAATAINIRLKNTFLQRFSVNRMINNISSIFHCRHNTKKHQYGLQLAIQIAAGDRWVSSGLNHFTHHAKDRYSLSSRTDFRSSGFLCDQVTERGHDFSEALNDRKNCRVIFWPFLRLLKLVRMRLKAIFAPSRHEADLKSALQPFHAILLLIFIAF